MGNGNIDVGNESPTRKAGQPIAKSLSGSSGCSELRIDPSVKTGRQEKPSENPASLCGAMSQQGGEFGGNVSAPQKFVQLVGCREPKIRPPAEARQYSSPLKR